MAAYELPARTFRADDRPYVRFSDQVSEFVSDFPKDENKPFVFFGHSLGGLLAYETALKLAEQGQKPAAVIISAVHPEIQRPGFQTVIDAAVTHGVPYDQAIEYLTPFRLDLLLLETLQLTRQAEDTSFPVLLISPKKDTNAAKETLLRAWKPFLSTVPEVLTVEGNHFYFKDNKGFFEFLSLYVQTMTT